MKALIKELIADGDYNGAIDRAMQEYREIKHATIASWFAEAGLQSRSVATEVARISACLNPNKKEYFKPVEWWVIQSKSGNYTMYETESQFYGFSRPVELEQAALLKKKKALEAELKMTEAMLSGEGVQSRRALHLYSTTTKHA